MSARHQSLAQDPRLDSLAALLTPTASRDQTGQSPSWQLHDPQVLYRNWEHEQWNPWPLDLVADRDQWQTALGEQDKALVYWAP